MKRTDIKAGVVYAVKNNYGPPVPIVFLEDGARGIYSRPPYGRGAPVERDPKVYKAKRGRGWDGTDCGYAAIKGGSAHGTDAAEALHSIDAPAELARFLGDKTPADGGLSFQIITSLTGIDGLFAAELAAYEARQQAEREADQRRAEQKAAAAERAGSLQESLSTYGIRVARATDDGFFLKLDEAGKLLGLLRDREA